MRKNPQQPHRSPESRVWSRVSHGGAALLLDVIIAVAIFSVLFSAILTTLQLSAKALIEYRNRLAALYLVTSQLEKARSLTYASVGTTGGTPSGVLAPSEVITENLVPFTRTTAVEYVDDPHDGLGVGDTNGKPNDYKKIQVTVSWDFKGQPRSISSSSIVSPPGIEP